MNERTALTENIARYRTAALICFTFAVLLYTVVVTLHMSASMIERLASLGVAWWLVGCGLVALTAYWAWRRALLDRE